MIKAVEKLGLLSNMIESKLSRKKFPLFVIWSLTNRCNNRCKYCGIPENLSAELATEQVICIIRELKTLGTKMISFSGGEPLLRNDIGRILDFCYENGIVTTLLSNSILIPSKIKNILKVGRLKLSLDGSKEINDFLRGDGLYSKVMEAVRIGRNHKINITLTCVLTKHNLACVDFLIDKAKELGVFIRFHPVSFAHAAGKDITSLFAPVNQYRQTIKKIMIKKIKLGNIENSLSSLRYMYYWPNSLPIENCIAGRIYCRISSRGDIFPCSSLEGKYPALNCLRNGVKEAFLNLTESGRNIKCEGCYCSGTLELNMVYNLKLDIFSMAKIFWKI